MNDVTRLLSDIERGDRQAAADLLPLVYGELRQLAARRLAQEQPGQTLQATALVHEAYLRLVQGQDDPGWHSRVHFFAAAAEAMRRILIDNARRKRTAKHGGGLKRIDLDDLDLSDETPLDEILTLDAALTKLEAVEPEVAALVKLRHFAGLTIEDTARALGISIATAKRRWVYARAWLFREIRGAGP